MKTTKRILALVICVMMIVGVLPMGIFAVSNDTSMVGDYHIELPFDDAGTKQTSFYFNSKKGTSDFTYTGDTSWHTYVTDTETGNVYVSKTNASSNGYEVSSPTAFTNRTFKISFKMRLNFNSSAGIASVSAGMFPIVRISPDGAPSTGTGNLLGVYPNKAETDGTIGNFGYTTGNGTGGWTEFEYECVKNTWYDIELIYNSKTTRGIVNITDGTTPFCGVIDCLAMDTIASVLLFRGYNSVWMNVDLDNLCFSSDAGLNSVADFNDIVLEDGTTNLSGVPALEEFTGSGSYELYTITEEEGGNKYLTFPKSSTTGPLTWAPVMPLRLNDGAFEISFDHKFESGTNNDKRGMLSIKTTKSSSSGEIRIIGMDGSGNLYFGPGESYKIGVLTTASSQGGAQWHNVKTVFIPCGTEMLYEFYIDNVLMAYTDIIDIYDEEGNVTHSYNFYTKVSGDWVVSEGLVGGKSYNVTTEDATEETWTWQSSSWGSDQNNAPRTPIGLWDGYTKVATDGTESSTGDGIIDTIKSIYMFHNNKGNFSLDNLTVKQVEREEISNVELVGWQQGTGDNSTSLRVIAGISSLDFSNVGIDIELYDAETDNWVKKVSNEKTNTVYTSLIADSKTVTAGEKGARYMVMLAIENINSDGIIRVSPYTTLNGEKTYGESKIYWLDSQADGSLVIKSEKDFETYIQNFYDGFSTSGDGYTGSASSDWDTLCNPQYDIRWGGDRSSSATFNAADGSVKFTVNPRITKYYTATGDTTDATNALTDANGNKLIKSYGMSGRVKFADVIPADLNDYKGSTFVLSAKIKVTEIKKVVDNASTVTVDNKNYSIPALQTVEKGTTATIDFGFMNDAKTWLLGGSSLDVNGATTPATYTVTANGEWMEISTFLVVTDDLISTLKTQCGSVTDSEGEVHAFPLRPTIEFGKANSYVSEMYIDDIVLQIIPSTLG